MSDVVVTAILSLIGLIFLILCFTLLSVRARVFGDAKVSWKGLGVTFEITPQLRETKEIHRARKENDK